MHCKKPLKPTPSPHFVEKQLIISNMKKCLVLLLLLSFCNSETNQSDPLDSVNNEPVETPVEVQNTSTTTIYENSYLIKNFESAPQGTVRIVVKGVSVELNENIEFQNVEF